MKRLALILSLLLLLCGCAAEVSETEEPVANVTGGTGIEGTWKSESSTATTVFAINDDGSIEIYEEGDGILGQSGTILINGTYVSDGSTLAVVVENSTSSEGEEPQIPEELVFTDTLDGDQLTVNYNGKSVNLSRQ